MKTGTEKRTFTSTTDQRSHAMTSTISSFLKLSTALSAYLLACHLADAGMTFATFIG